jgi:multidrug resistance protein, MATE family
MMVTYKHEIKQSLKLAGPLMVALLVQSGMWLVDSMMMGSLGPAALAAGALAITSYYLIQVFFLGLTNAVGISIGHARGASDDEDIARQFVQGGYLVLMITIPMMLVLWAVPHLFFALGQKQIVVNLASQYIVGSLWGALGMLGFALCREFCANLEMPNLIMYISAVALVLNGVLDYCFIHGLFGFPKMGMFGLGLATSIVQWIMFIAMFLCVFLKSNLKKYVGLSAVNVDFRVILSLLKIGLPMSFTYFIEAGLFNVSAIMMGWVSISALAAHQILLQCIETAFMCFFAIAQTTSIRAAFHTGGGNVQGVQVAARVNVCLGMIVALFISVLFLFFDKQILALFTNMHDHRHLQVSLLARKFFHIAAIFVFFDALQIIGNNALRGVKDTFIPMFLGLGSYWIVGILGAYFFAFTCHLAGTGIWLGLTAGVSVSALTIWLRWFYCMGKKSTLVCNGVDE